MPTAAACFYTSPSSKAHQKSGSFPPPALPSFNGRMTLSDSRQGRRLSATLRSLPSHRTGLPRLLASSFRRAVSTTPADRAGAHVDCFPAHAAFPKWQEGRHPHWDFRGLLGLHACYGPLNCSTAHGGLCHEASTQMVAHPSRSSATGAIDNSPGGPYRHWRHTHTGRTSFDYLVGAQQRLRDGEERPGGLAICDKSNLVCCLTEISTMRHLCQVRM
jgi:hypothetical protein